MKRRGWILYRASNLPPTAPGHEVRKHLRISERTMKAWYADPFFRKSVGTKKDGRWEIKRDALLYWLVATGNCGPRRGITVKRQTARAALGIPLGHKIYGESDSPRAGARARNRRSDA